MKIEKKIAAISIFALVIGIATVLPIAYFQPISGVTVQSTQPYFNPNIFNIIAIPYIGSLYDEPYTTCVDVDGTVYRMEIPDGGSIGTLMCYDITPEGANLEDVDAKIEVYKFHFYSDQTSILNMTHSVAIAGKVSDPNDPARIIDAITESNSNQNTYTFADGTIYDLTEALGYVEENTLGFYSAEWSTAAKGHHNFGGGPYLSATGDEKSAQALANLRDAKTIYVEITRVLQITYKHPSSPLESSVITVTPTSNDILYYIALSELDSLGRAVYETNHVGYIPTFEDLGLDIHMFDLP
ncbi:hypothetical protein [Candidatus Bathycorpusculum sp.]|jgi:hypothetical protein|uniref:hypothetical protein n=1 Tax=Candidatus Bathycorpusculum sp. TaxID=2994959 RepID=UPI0028172EEA|nr:hypothetical protein [Candidatus Termitimicrobium sp.]MCL2431721.1 hypothetical protein [Candidatus Termitimicrobium sp.]